MGVDFSGHGFLIDSFSIFYVMLLRIFCTSGKDYDVDLRILEFENELLDNLIY